MEKDTVFWDRDLPGFGVRVYASGKKMYVVQSRADGKSVRVTVGRHGVITREDGNRLITNATRQGWLFLPALILRPALMLLGLSRPISWRHPMAQSWCLTIGPGESTSSGTWVDKRPRVTPLARPGQMTCPCRTRRRKRPEFGWPR